MNEMKASVAAAIQPLVTRLEALESAIAIPDHPPVHRPPSTVDPVPWELRHMKHSIRGTVYVPQAMKEELPRRAAAIGQNPSLLVQEALARYLAEEERQ